MNANRIQSQLDVLNRFLIMTANSDVSIRRKIVNIYKFLSHLKSELNTETNDEIEK